MKKLVLSTALIMSFLNLTAQTDVPNVKITNDIIDAILYLPDIEKGYYRGTRFDRSGIVASLEYNGHTFFGQWFENYNPETHDAVLGPVEEFGQIGFDVAKPGETFLKIGVGMLEKPDEKPYSNFRLYPVKNAGKWQISNDKRSVKFTHILEDKEYSYQYEKQISLVSGKPEMIISHSLTNTGKLPLETTVYDHNFPVIDKQPVGPGYIITFTFNPECSDKGFEGVVAIQGNKLVYLKNQVPDEKVYCTDLKGYGNTPADYDIRIENHNSRAGMRVTCNRPLVRLAYWSSTTTVCPEPFIKISVKPGEKFEWQIKYEFYTNIASAQSGFQYPFFNPSLPVEERVNDLVKRMTLEEKIGQMMNAAPAIERLGIPKYDWWNECLHGVGRAGLATVFPQAIGLAATWDEELFLRVSTAISDEARAKHHEFVRNNSRERYQGLTFWTPNINIFRDPRWGRGQETYGEDPYLTGKLAVQFIKGLQGDNPKYFKTISTVKHYVVHSGPEPERHTFDAVTDKRDLLETYLPHFEMSIKEGKVYSVMCAYNRYNGEACCGSNYLLNGIIRDEWGFKGYIVSDCGAISDIYRGHKIVGTPAEAAALAVKSGTDLECASVYRSLKEAVEKGLITEQEIDVSVKRLFTARMKLGMFDPPEMVPYSSIPYSVNDCQEHKDLARLTACKSIVLLKNEGNLLPLRKDIGKIAVIGPNSDETFVLLGNYNGTPSNPVTPLRGIREKVSGASEVLYARGCNWVEGMPDQKPSDEMISEALNIAKTADVVIMCMGITPRLEGEEMRVNAEGFSGGDRTRIDLPDIQQELIKKVHALGKPVILVLLNGSAIAVNWEKENISAIIEAWYPGQAGGQAIADVIFGDYNPAGRLPVTFYKSVKDLPPFEDYNMKNRTYRYFTGEPLYPFGYGLSYTTFGYSKMKVKKTIKTGEPVEVSVNVRNTGKKDGEEVVQLYVSNLSAKVPVPLRTLKGFKRIDLKAGESKTVVFKLAPEDFSFVDEEYKRVIKPGKFLISVGSCSPMQGIERSEPGILKKIIELN